MALDGAFLHFIKMKLHRISVRVLIKFISLPGRNRHHASGKGTRINCCFLRAQTALVFILPKKALKILRHRRCFASCSESIWAAEN